MQWGPWQDVKGRERVSRLSYCDNLSDRHVIEIEATDGSTYVLAQTNFLGGVCDDCVEIDRNLLAKRYRVMSV